MDIPVYKHTIGHIKSVLYDGDYTLQTISDLVRYDPGLSVAIIRDVNAIRKNAEITSLFHALSFIGSEGIENLIRKKSYLFDEENMLLWCYSIIAGETAVRINDMVDITDHEQAFFAGALSSAAILPMLKKYPDYTKILELMLKISLRDRLFIERRLFKTDQLQEMSSILPSPELYSNLINLLMGIFADEHRRHFVYPPRFSSLSKSYQLMQLMNISETASQIILFPSVVEAGEKFREMASRYFRISEAVAEILLASVEEKFESICKKFEVNELLEKFISRAENYHIQEIKFQTKSEPFGEALSAVSKSNREDRNIFIQGDTGVGKRLLALSLHQEDNPRQKKPYLSVFCGTFNSEILWAELFGVKDGFLGMDEHKGIIELASGGTVLLKDIDKIPLEMQDKIAEIFNSGKFYRLGEVQPCYFNVRIICTSHKNILAEADNKRFSKKLLDVLRPDRICIPPLRERREDIEFIADSIIKKYNLNLTDRALRPSLQEYYRTHQFNENLFELKRLLFFLSAKHTLAS